MTLTALEMRDSKFKRWCFDVELATTRSWWPPTILIFYEWAKKKHCVSLQPEYHEDQPGNTKRLLDGGKKLDHRLRRQTNIKPATTYRVKWTGNHCFIHVLQRIHIIINDIGNTVEDNNCSHIAWCQSRSLSFIIHTYQTPLILIWHIGHSI